MDYVGSLDSSRDLQPICAKSFVNRLHLVLQISKIPLQKFFATKLNTALVLLLDEAAMSWHSCWRFQILFEVNCMTASVTMVVWPLGLRQTTKLDHFLFCHVQWVCKSVGRRTEECISQCHPVISMHVTI